MARRHRRNISQLLAAALTVGYAQLAHTQESSDATSVARAALVASLEYSVLGTARPGPIFVDAEAFSRAIRRAMGENLDVDAIVAAVGSRGRPATGLEALSCEGEPGRAVCSVSENGVYFSLDSLTLSGTRAAAYVRYRYTTRIGPNREVPYVGFVQLRVELQRGSSGWIVTERTVTMRS